MQNHFFPSFIIYDSFTRHSISKTSSNYTVKSSKHGYMFMYNSFKSQVSCYSTWTTVSCLINGILDMLNNSHEEAPAVLLVAGY